MPNLNKSKKACYKKGREVEILFSGIAAEYGFHIEECSENENMFDHTDFRLTNEHGTVSMDVKARKKKNRQNKKYDDEWVWIEFKNVNGDDGWIYGKADYIVFEREFDFVLIPRKKLLNWTLQAMKKHNPEELKAKSVNSAKYRLYKRFRRFDSITQIELKEALEEIDGIQFWKKEV